MTYLKNKHKTLMNPEINKKNNIDLLNLTKADLIRYISIECKITIKESQTVIDTLFNVIKESIEQGGTVKLNGFGNFSSIVIPPRSVINPKTLLPMITEPVRKVKFKVSSVMRLKNNISREELFAAKEKKQLDKNKKS